VPTHRGGEIRRASRFAQPSAIFGHRQSCRAKAGRKRWRRRGRRRSGRRKGRASAGFGNGDPRTAHSWIGITTDATSNLQLVGFLGRWPLRSNQFLNLICRIVNRGFHLYEFSTF
jgi:hypothetical protein